MSLTLGTRLGSYEVLALLGSGGMGEVYRARDLRLGREVAIKVLRQEYAADRDRLARFEQEARAASALNHPHIVTIFEIGEAEGTRYIAMELIRGRVLRDMLRSGPFAIPSLLDYAVQAADGLAKAHDAGIIHRDLKPENLMVTEDGLVKILDFGLAKLAPRPFDDASDGEMVSRSPTRSGMLVGTVEYMSPEQASGRPVDHRTDQFTLGMVLYEMATGERPFQRKTAAQTLAAIIESDVAPLDQRSRAVPPGLAAVVSRCLAKEPSARYASTRDLAQALRELKANPAAAVEAAPPAVPAQALARRPEVFVDYYVQAEHGIKRMTEAKLRKRLRSGSFSGLELVRRGEAGEWEVLHDTGLFREEVPTTGDPRDAARWRLLQQFAIHAATFLGLGVFFTLQSGGHPPFWMIFWGMGLFSHGMRVVPAFFGLAREGKLRLPGLSGERRAALPNAEKPKALLPPELVAEAERVRSLLRHREKGGELLKEVDQLVAAMSSLVAKQADLEEQTAPAEFEHLKEAEREAQEKLARAESAYDRQLFQRQIEVLTHRRHAIERALVMLERMRVRRSMAEHQLKQLRLDLSQAEARRMGAPELSSRILDIRHEVDAFDQADEILARE